MLINTLLYTAEDGIGMIYLLETFPNSTKVFSDTIRNTEV